MKKVLLLICLLLSSCAFRSDYYTLYVDGYKFTVGYDDVDYLNTTFDIDIKDTLDINETINDVDAKLLNQRFCTFAVTNNTDEIIDTKDGIISELKIYVDDVGTRTYKIDDIELDDSVTSSCNKLGGSLIERNGYACLLQSDKSGQLNVVELHGDILASDQDKLEHIKIYVK